jgi:formylglycine-generating enzyme required for sulfatase activity
MKKVLMSIVMMGMAAGAYAAEFGDLAVKATDLKAMAGISKGYVEPVEPATPIEWVSIIGGKFTMGTTSIEQGFEDAKSVREVTIETFTMSKTDVTVAQYYECVTKDACTKPATGDYCNWGKPGRGNHPVNCVDWNQANQYAKFAGARLPSESEWEYAATSGGRNQKYPWGNDEPTSELAVFNTSSTMPVCSKPKGNTAQGLCDMSGNVCQWVQDIYKNSYAGASDEGSALDAMASIRVMRGGSFRYGYATRTLRADYRSNGVPGSRYSYVGFRLAR